MAMFKEMLVDGEISPEEYAHIIAIEAESALHEEAVPLSGLELSGVGPPSPAREGNRSPGRVRVSQSSVQDRLGRNYGGGMRYFV